MGEPAEIATVPADGGAEQIAVPATRRALFPFPARDGGLLYSANPDTVDLALWWKPAGGEASGSRQGCPRGIDWTPDGQHIILGLQERTADIVLLDQGAPAAQR